MPNSIRHTEVYEGRAVKPKYGRARQLQADGKEGPTARGALVLGLGVLRRGRRNVDRRDLRHAVERGVGGGQFGPAVLLRGVAALERRLAGGDAVLGGRVLVAGLGGNGDARGGRRVELRVRAGLDDRGGLAVDVGELLRWRDLDGGLAVLDPEPGLGDAPDVLGDGDALDVALVVEDLLDLVGHDHRRALVVGRQALGLALRLALRGEGLVLR